MNALFDSIHNFILPLLRGEDGVCACTCGRHQDYHVIPYEEDQSVVDFRENSVLGDVMTRQEVNMLTGLVLGFCINFFLQWLDRMWLSGLKHWRLYQTNDVGFWSWVPKFRNTRKKVTLLDPNHTEDSRRNTLQEHTAHQSSYLP
ncbi:transmembrane protein 240-like [Centropristis striata]|uniref:transmembrane protein 240-like n=1 Tax=Centropristis striata TaxID=184440 RepID=UPI0027E1BA9F|nr:transmembrane protein 240-like [Centropristis striata]XP_059185893.1 transmembrane protein 240-like [Centropristis striata]